MYGDVVLGLGHAPFEAALAAVKAGAGKALDVELDSTDLRGVVARFKEVYRGAGAELPADPREQLKSAVAAVFRSWNTPRAVKYREINRIREPENRRESGRAAGLIDRPLSPANNQPTDQPTST
jgi:pyruvate,orthophosphate dikinase